MTKTIKLRPWQSEAINKCLNWFLLENKKKFLINAAPGAGKTICASVIAEKLIALHKQGDQKVINNVLATMDERRESGRMRYGEYLTWQSLLEIIDDNDAFIKGMTEDTSQMRKYRRSTPFVGILSEEERTVALEKNAIGYLDLV